MKYSLGIECDYFLSMKNGEVLPERNIFIGIQDNKIVHIAPQSKELRQNCDELIEAKNQVVMPGFVNGHTHLPMSLMRGLEDDLPFQQWLFERILPLEQKLVTADFVRIGTELSALECIRFGTTTVADMYFYAQDVVNVWDKAGLRGLISQVFADFPLPEDSVLGNDKSHLFAQLHERCTGHSRLHASLGPHAPYSCGDETLKKVRALSDKFGAPVQIHLSETRNEVEESIKKYGKTPVQRLYDVGFLSSKTICAHCVHLNEADMELMHKSEAHAIYNPDSNLKLSSGIAPIPQYLSKGISVGLGTDGAASNNDLSMFSAMDVGTKIQKLAAGRNDIMSAEQALRLATYSGAKALGLLDQVGSLEIGKRADIAIVDLNFPHMQPVHNIASQLVYSAQGLEVHTVICDGRILMENKKIQVLDETTIYHEAQGLRDKIQTALRNF